MAGHGFRGTILDLFSPLVRDSPAYETSNDDVTGLQLPEDTAASSTASTADIDDDHDDTPTTALEAAMPAVTLVEDCR